MGERRPIRSRESQFAKWAVQKLALTKITPNQISILSVIFALFAGFCFILSKSTLFYYRITFLVLAILFIQLRLLCNLFDGMLAVEYGLKSKSGEIFNDLPDRFSDLFIIAGVGYSLFTPSWGIELGYLAAFGSLLTAYIRILGGAIGTQQYFIGPMAKQHRMALLTFATALSIVGISTTLNFLFYALILIAVGSLITVVRRYYFIMRELENKNG